MPISFEVNGQYRGVVEQGQVREFSTEDGATFRLSGLRAGGDVYAPDERLFHLPCFGLDGAGRAGTQLVSSIKFDIKKGSVIVRVVAPQS